MILFFVLLIAIIVSSILVYVGFDNDSGVITFPSLTVLVLAGSSFLIVVCMTIGTHNKWMTEQDKIAYIEKRKTIMYFLETQPENSMLLVDDIAKYNKAIMQGRRANANLWFNWETYDFWDELEPIELN
jgi:hypothetical protein